MVSRIETLILKGLQASPVKVEVDIAFGLPAFNIVGLAAASIMESRERVKSAIRNSHFSFPTHRITINLAPAYLRKDAPHIDLAIAIGILLASELLQDDKVKRLYCAELSLDGSLQPVAGLLALLEAAEIAGYHEVIIPVTQQSVAAIYRPKQIKIYAARTLRQVVTHIQGVSLLPVIQMHFPIFTDDQQLSSIDMGQIIGQQAAKRAVEIAASGGHHLFMSGSPGMGKTMLAQALHSILPVLTSHQLFEIAKITSLFPSSSPLLSPVPPFRAPHHSVSDTVLLGGGNYPKPGEISLAHHGVLFLDELLEFSRQSLEALRQPLEANEISLHRQNLTVTYPAQFQLIGAYNPCPCGYLGSSNRTCSCTTLQIAQYQKKLSGPLLDRIDLQVCVHSEKISSTSAMQSESSAKVRQRVTTVRRLQAERYKHESFKLNAQLPVNRLRHYCQLTKPTARLLRQAVEQYGLSLRAMHKIVRVARTIADMAGSPQITEVHIAEACQYRFPTK